jgi:hypothetical protein
MSRNRAPATRPCATICITAPVKPAVLRAASAEQHDAHVGDRGIGDHRLQVALLPGQHAAVDQADQGQRHQQALQRLGGVGQHPDGADQAVGTHLEQDAGQQDRHRAGRFDVRQRQPAVQREDRHLHAEADQQAKEQRDLGRLRQQARALADRAMSKLWPGATSYSMSRAISMNTEPPMV